MYEIGFALTCSPACHLANCSLEERDTQDRDAILYKQCCSAAKRAVMCWLWLARATTVVKDVQLLIADLIWDARADWSELVCVA